MGIQMLEVILRSSPTLGAISAVYHQRCLESPSCYEFLGFDIPSNRIVPNCRCQEQLDIVLKPAHPSGVAGSTCGAGRQREIAGVGLLSASLSSEIKAKFTWATQRVRDPLGEDVFLAGARATTERAASTMFHGSDDA